MPTATIADQPIHYERRGSGEPLLMIMGMSGTLRHWYEPFVTLLEPHFELIRFDNRGTGHTPPSPEPFTIADLAGDAIGLLDALELEQAHVLGISMGGMIAQQLTLDHPQRVRTLALGCTWHGGPGVVQTPPETIAALGAAIASGDPRAVGRVGWEHNVSPAFVENEAALAELRDIEAKTPLDPAVVMAQLQAVMGFDVAARLGEIDVPTLVMHGTLDRLIPAGNGQLLADAIPGARLEIFEDVAHLFFWERPERAAELVREHAGTRSAA